VKIAPSWTGQCVGFVPYTFWHKDETANTAEPRDLLFFQDFGLRERPLVDVVERPEITLADVLDVINGRGRFSYLQNCAGWKPHYARITRGHLGRAIAFLMRHGYKAAPVEFVPDHFFSLRFLQR
jgi:hypothetical protein